MGDSETHQLATRLRKAAQIVEDGNARSLAVVLIQQDGDVNQVTHAEDALGLHLLLGALSIAGGDLQAQWRALRSAQAASQLSEPSGAEVAAFGRKRKPN